MSQQVHCSIGAISFPHETSPEQFVSRPLRATALCVPNVHHFTRNMHAQIRERNIYCSFFSARKKNCHHHVNGLGDLPFISLVCSHARNLKKIFSIQLATWGKKKETSTSNENLQGYLKHMHTCIVFLINVKKTNRDIFFRSIDRLVNSLDDLLFPLKSFKVFPSFSTISCDCITYPYMLYTSFNT